jgi:recombination protein RecR
LQTYSSSLLEKAVNELSRLPGIGRKTALRLALHLLRQERQEVEALGHSIITMRNEVIYCRNCHNISDEEFCTICRNPSRDHSLICVVEDIRDVMAIEKTNQFTGVYHVLGGVISPIEGIGPLDINIASLIERIDAQTVGEVILALPTTIEGDTTGFYISRKITGENIRLSAIARGISIGDELEYTDEVTLGRSIVNRVPYQSMMPAGKGKA